MSDNRSIAEDFRLYGRVFKEAKPWWKNLVGIFSIRLLWIPLTLLVPLPIKITVDHILGEKELSPLLAQVIPDYFSNDVGRMIFMVAGMVVLIALLQHLITLISLYLQSTTGEALMREFRSKLFDKSQRVSLTYHDSKGSSDSVYRIYWDALSIKYIAFDGVFPFITAIITVVAMFLVAWSFDWLLALLAIGVLPLIYYFTQKSRHHLRREWEKVKEEESASTGILQQVLSSIRVVKAFGRESHESDRFYQLAGKVGKGYNKISLISGFFGLANGLTMGLGTAAVLLFGILHVRSGIITLGELLLIMSYLTQLYTPIDQMAKGVAILQNQLAGAERSFTLLDKDRDVPETENPITLERAKGEVLYEQVSFGYEEGETVLKDISFSIAPGSKVGIAGHTGCGKSTLVNLLMRLYDPKQGSIKLDGIDIRKYKLQDLRNQFAVVLQDPGPFAATVSENIGYAKSGASDEEIMEAAKAANAHSFIQNSSDGYASMVGERGMSLSGGERQRISIARAFLRNAPILIFDEPTSSVDAKTEASIMQSLYRLSENKTTFIIAHRTSTLDKCDFIINLSEGCMISKIEPKPPVQSQVQ